MFTSNVTVHFIINKIININDALKRENNDKVDIRSTYKV